MTRGGAWAAGVALAIGLLASTGAGRPAPAYLFYVASESDDEVTLVRFTPGEGLVAQKVISVGALPAEIEAPHGVFVDPSGDTWYLTLGHGFPFGSLVKYATGSDTVLGAVELGMFPATIAIPPFGGLALAVNSDFHGPMEPSSVSVVDLVTMDELLQVPTCVMPHGSRFSPDGMKHYSACMMTDEFVEIDLQTLAVSRRLHLADGRHASNGNGQAPCSPTWTAPHPDGRRVYVTCNKRDEVLEIDVKRWEVARRLSAPGAPYNADVSPDGRRLVVTQKGGAAITVFDLPTGDALARIPSSRRVTHGIVVSPDNRYAFVTVEGIGGEPGTVEAIDLGTLERVAALDVGKQAGGIAFWKMEGR